MSRRVPAVRARVYLRDSATFEGAGVRDVSVHHGIMGLDRSSGMLSSRPLRFHADLPAVGRRSEIDASLLRVRQVLDRGLITLTEDELHEPGGATDVTLGEAT